jgi:hypothetical protein
VIPGSVPPAVVVVVVGAVVVGVLLGGGLMTTVGFGVVGTRFGGTSFVVVVVVVLDDVLGARVVVVDEVGVRTDWFPPPLLNATPIPIAAAMTPRSVTTMITDLRSTGAPPSTEPV